MGKVDLKKDLKHLYNPSAVEVSVVDVPPMNFLMVNGTGDPNVSLEYQQAMEALFSLSYALKFKIKKSTGVDYAVMPLEGLWWTDDPSQFSMSNKAIWKWTAMIMQPEYVAAEMVAEALDEVRKKKGSPALERVRFETYHEGLSAQIMHIGPYAASLFVGRYKLPPNTSLQPTVPRSTPAANALSAIRKGANDAASYPFRNPR
ncbi:MAG: GyrI-like domain-containing protein [Chloroflexi bacterium]|nr:GyrI-like domain-containing protein [Chloroflexota bacterium]